MSAPLAGKFQDHYEVLGVEPNAELETIQMAYTRLAQELHPNQPETGDREKFDAVNLAYEVLSQQDLRSAFDKLKGVGTENSSPKFTGRPFFDSLGRDNGLRVALLCVLYDRRRQKPFTPSLSVRHVENIIAASLEEMTLVLWYLKERRWIISDDKSSLQITMEGMDYLENNAPSAELVMPWIKASGLIAAQQPPAADEEDPAPTQSDVVAEEVDYEDVNYEAAANDAVAFEELVLDDDLSDENLSDEAPLGYTAADDIEEETELETDASVLDDPLRRANLNRILAR